MKKLMITAAALMIAVAAYGQGQFLFNTHDTGAGNVLTFTDPSGAKIAGANYFLDVLVGADAAHLAPIVGDAGGPLAINRVLSSGAASGFTNPFSEIVTVPGSPANTKVVVGYRAYQGTAGGYDAATVKSPVVVVPGTVTLTEPPTPPTEVALGTQTVVVGVPEPTTLALGLLGIGTLLALRRRQ